MLVGIPARTRLQRRSGGREVRASRRAGWQADSARASVNLGFVTEARKQLIDVGIAFENGADRPRCTTTVMLRLRIGSLQLAKERRRQYEIAECIEPEEDEGLPRVR